jgi:hypothetical protein
LPKTGWFSPTGLPKWNFPAQAKARLEWAARRALDVILKQEKEARPPSR